MTYSVHRQPPFSGFKFTPFEITYRLSVPENGGVYRLNDLRGTLYVGKTNSLRRRFQEHLDPNNWLIQQALQHRDGRLKFGWKAISSSEKRGQQERQLIQYYEPPCNRVMFEGE